MKIDSRITASADRVMKNIFKFDGPLDMEQTTFEFKFDGSFPLWNFNPSKDPEWTFMLVRQGYLIDLLACYISSNKEIYAERIVDLICDFIKNEPYSPSKEKSTWRSIDAGIRILNWILCLVELEKQGYSFNSKKDIFHKGLEDHCSYLKSIDNTHSVISNWGILSNTGLFCASKYLSNLDDETLAIRRIEKSCCLQITQDGFCWEQSPLYNVEVLNSLLECLEFGIQSKIIYEKAYLLTKTLCCIIKPDGKLFLQGDSDSIDVRPLISKAALYYEDGYFKSIGKDKFDFLTSRKINNSYRNISLCNIEVDDCISYESGNYYLKLGTLSNQTIVRFRGGSQGSGHGHNDLLHFDIYSKGSDVLVDSGRYTYLPSKERELFKSAFMHNTITINRKDPFGYKTAWKSQKKCEYLSGPYLNRKDWKLINCSNLGFIDDYSTIVNRKIFLLSKEIVFIYDSIFSNEEYTMQRYFHFDDKCSVYESSKDIYNVKIGLNNFKCIMDDDIVSKTITPYSKKYNEKENRISLITDNICKGNSFRYFCFSTYSDINICEAIVRSDNTGEIFPKSMVRAFKLCSEYNKELMIIIGLSDCLENGDLLNIEGEVFYGKTIIKQGKRVEVFEI